MKTIVSIQTHLTIEIEGEKDEICGQFLGEWQQEGATHCLVYKEPDNKGTTHLLANPSFTEIVRKGDISSTLRFQKKHKQTLNYETPDGHLTMQCLTHDYAHHFAPDTCWVEAVYQLLMGDTAVSYNKIRITWRVADKSSATAP